MTPPANPELVGLLLEASLTDPFAFLGLHAEGDGLVLRCFVPEASAVMVVDAATRRVVANLDRIHEAGLFAGPVPGAAPFPYLLRTETKAGLHDVQDPYRFGSVLGETDRYLLAEGTHLEAYDRMGAHALVRDGVPGIGFAVWAPNARSVSVVGSFNGWDGRRHPMRLHPACGIWDLFIPAARPGDCYKYEIHRSDGVRLPLKADPYASVGELRPANASVIESPTQHAWRDGAWREARKKINERDAPISIYEVHLGSWKRSGEEGHRTLTYREIAAQLIPYVVEMGFTHIELLPIAEFPFDGSWGYQSTGLCAPTSRFGSPDDFRAFVDACHDAGIGLILDWVGSHFPTDEFGLAAFDGTHLYEHADPRQGFQQDWNTLVYNYGRREVANFLINSALCWLKRYHVDGLRCDAVASMLYLDYSRRAGEWIPNAFGGRENLEAIALLRRLNIVAYGEEPGCTMIAEESTAWPMVSKPTYIGGLGFGYKWNMGWMHDTLEYIALDPIHRKYRHNQLTFGLHYAFTENFVLPISHDEVVHGKGSLLAKMPGDTWQKFANLRAYLGFMWTHPGKKLIFMGCEFGQVREWNFEASLDWHLLRDPLHQGVRTLVRDLNHLYRSLPALHKYDCDDAGFEWIDATDSHQSVISFLRKDGVGGVVLVVCNFTPVVRHEYRVGVPAAGQWTEVLNTDAACFGGSGVGNGGQAHTQPLGAQGRQHSLALTLPPLATVVFTGPA